MTDEELMAAYAAGDPRSFAAVFQRWAPRIHGFFMRAIGDRQSADDLLQVTFLKVHRARAEFRPESPLRSWLFSIAAHALQDELRRRKRLPLAREEQQEAMAQPQLPTPTQSRWNPASEWARCALPWRSCRCRNARCFISIASSR